MKRKYLILLLSVLLFIGLQFLSPQKPTYEPIKDLTGVPQDINDFLRGSCFDCHSTQMQLRWYDQISPFNILVYEHIAKARAALDFSKWDELDSIQQKTKLFYSLNKIIAKEMPLLSYTAIHPETKVSDEAIERFKEFLIVKTPRKRVNEQQATIARLEFEAFAEGKLGSIRDSVIPAPNGIAYIDNYRNWEVISVSDRFDNGTIRIIYGNNIAVKAIQNRTINPWPNGSIIAKAAWHQLTNKDGSVSPGKFAQVEFMIKDAVAYKHTMGWGWARWKGSELKPYGKNATFVNECISCHKPVKDNDYMFTKPFYLKENATKN